MRVALTPSARHDLDALDPQVRHRVLRKLEWFVRSDDPLIFAEPLSHSKLGTWRFRIGDWRVTFDVAEDCIVVLRIGNRRDIYR